MLQANPPGCAPGTTRLVQEQAAGNATLRLGFGIVALCGAAWLFAVDGRAVPRLTAALGMLFGVLWIVRYLRSEHRTSQTELRLEPAGMTLRDHLGETQVAWCDVLRVELDHDALVVCVIRKADSEVRIEPGYGGLPLRELGQAVQDALTRYRACILTTDG